MKKFIKLTGILLSAMLCLPFFGCIHGDGPEQTYKVTYGFYTTGSSGAIKQTGTLDTNALPALPAGVETEHVYTGADAQAKYEACQIPANITLNFEGEDTVVPMIYNDTGLTASQVKELFEGLVNDAFVDSLLAESKAFGLSAGMAVPFYEEGTIDPIGYIHCYLFALVEKE